MKEKKEGSKVNLNILKLAFIILLSVGILFAGAFINKKVVIADSGFDSSYDSGGSDWGSSSSDWGSSSSYDWGSSSSYSSGSGGGGSVGSVFVFMIIIIVYIIFAVAKGSNNTTTSRPVQPVMPKVDEEAVLNKIKQYIPNFDKEKFLADGYQIYLDVQNAWMNFKLEDVKDKITDEMFNMYESQLDTLEVKGEQNIMKDFARRKAYLKDVVMQNNNITITTVYVIDFYDYIIDKSSGKVLRGTNKQKIRITYEMKFRQTLDKTSVATHCPNCGADLGKMNGATTCLYCGSKIVSENAKWVLTDKKNIGQVRL